MILTATLMTIVMRMIVICVFQIEIDIFRRNCSANSWIHNSYESDFASKESPARP